MVEMIPTLLDQLTGLSPMPKPQRNLTAEILDAMSDGTVWGRVLTLWRRHHETNP